MKGLLFFLIFSLFAELCMAEGLDGYFGTLSYSLTLETTKVNNESIQTFVGLGISVPLLFMEKTEENKVGSSYFMIEPFTAAETDFHDLLRIRMGVHVGELRAGFVLMGYYYAGLSGLCMHDFKSDITTGGVSLEIGFELVVVWGLKFQLRYDFYANDQYNGLVCTIGGSFLVFGY